MPSNIDKAFSRWLPKKAAKEVATAPVDKVTAALSLDAPDACPYCHAQLRMCVAMGIPSYICDKDRYVAPQPNTSEGEPT